METDNKAQKFTIRPTKTDESVINEAGKRVCALILDWLKMVGDDEDFDEKRVLENSKELLQNCFGDYDGYRLAKMLEDDCDYLPNADLVDKLEEVYHIVYEEHSKAVKQWVKENNVQPKFKIGDNVGFRHKNKTQNGEIYNIDFEVGQYFICCKDLGHVKEGKGTHGLVLNWENVENGF